MRDKEKRDRNWERKKETYWDRERERQEKVREREKERGTGAFY